MVNILQTTKYQALCWRYSRQTPSYLTVDFFSAVRELKCILIGTINRNLDRYLRIQTVVRTKTTPGHSELGCASSRDHSAENRRTLTGCTQYCYRSQSSYNRRAAGRILFPSRPLLETVTIVLRSSFVCKWNISTFVLVRTSRIFV